ncbi:MAG: hypothetical protein CMF67_11450 [Magnetovibrio sp.]|nr:hypothetical protein [Magnetovibrio sp.]
MTIKLISLDPPLPIDIAAALIGSLEIAPITNLYPEKDTVSLFEPVQGSTFDIIGQGIANPIS